LVALASLVHLGLHYQILKRSIFGILPCFGGKTHVAFVVVEIIRVVVISIPDHIQVGIVLLLGVPWDSVLQIERVQQALNFPGWHIGNHLDGDLPAWPFQFLLGFVGQLEVERGFQHALRGSEFLEYGSVEGQKLVGLLLDLGQSFGVLQNKAIQQLLGALLVLL